MASRTIHFKSKGQTVLPPDKERQARIEREVEETKQREQKEYERACREKERAARE